MITFQNVSFSYGKEELIKDVTFHVKAGEFVAMIGANGAGKSTVSKLMNGLLKPVKGTVLVKGQDTKAARSSQLAKHIGYLFQNPDRQICQNTIEEEIIFGLNYTVANEVERQLRLKKTLKHFHLDGTKNPFNISRGERQKVALASIAACEPEILVLDEPTTGLDYAECMEIMDYICKLNQKGTTIFMITHDMEIVQDFANKILLFNNGSLLAFDETKKIMKNREMLEKASVLPAQIPELAMLLGEEFEDVNTVQEMVDRIEDLTMNQLKVVNGGGY